MSCRLLDASQGSRMPFWSHTRSRRRSFGVASYKGVLQSRNHTKRDSLSCFRDLSASKRTAIAWSASFRVHTRMGPAGAFAGTDSPRRTSCTEHQRAKRVLCEIVRHSHHVCHALRLAHLNQRLANAASAHNNGRHSFAHTSGASRKDSAASVPAPDKLRLRLRGAQRHSYYQRDKLREKSVDVLTA